MYMFWMGFAAYAAVSISVNLFNAEFRRALARVLIDLALGPFTVLDVAARSGGRHRAEEIAFADPRADEWPYSLRDVAA